MKKAKKVVKCVVFCFILLLGIVWCTEFFEYKSTEIVSREYRDYGKDKFDVIFVGSSVMKNAVYPMQLYDEYGISSYNLGSGNQSIESSYYLIKEVIREQHPKVIVLDCQFVAYDKYFLSDEHLHYVTDMMSNIEKIQLVKDLVPSNKWEDFLFQLSRYHSRWKDLSRNDFIYDEHKTYGAKVHYSSIPIKDYCITNETKALPDITDKYIKKIIDLCIENEVKLVFTIMPIDFSDTKHSCLGDMNDNQKYFNMVGIIASNYGIPFLNFMNLVNETGIDPQKDYDGSLHLNAYGAEKMTKYIGKFLTDNYELPNVKNDVNYSYMQEDYKEFTNYKNNLEIKSTKNLVKYLELLEKYDNLCVLISVKDIQGYCLTPEITELMEKLGFENADVLLEKSYHSYLGIASAGNNIYEQIGNGDSLEESSIYDGKIGEDKILIESHTLHGGNYSSIKIDGIEHSKNGRGFNIVVLDKNTDEVIDSVNFDTHVSDIPCYR